MRVWTTPTPRPKDELEHMFDNQMWGWRVEQQRQQATPGRPGQKILNDTGNNDNVLINVAAWDGGFGEVEPVVTVCPTMALLP
jgi:hypothetical protein